jgi:hypothetical protein
MWLWLLIDGQFFEANMALLLSLSLLIFAVVGDSLDDEMDIVIHSDHRGGREYLFKDIGVHITNGRSTDLILAGSGQSLPISGGHSSRALARRHAGSGRMPWPPLPALSSLSCFRQYP